VGRARGRKAKWAVGNWVAGWVASLFFLSFFFF
jgi:hypothetical protein